MEPKIIKEEAIERDTSVLDEPAINNNNNKESAFRIHTRKSKIKSKDAGFSSTSTSDSSGEHLLSPTHPLPAQIDGESESSSPPSDTFRNHSNIKRFLTTLVQFSGQVSPQTSDRVKGQIFTLVNNMISVEEFHHNIQEMTNFPLRPFVLPFLRTHLPSLQRDLLVMARNNKQTLSQYLKQHENAYLDRDSQPSEPSEIFHQVERVPAPSPMAARENNNNNNNNNNNGGGHKRPYPLAAAAAAMTAMQAAADGYYDAGYAADLDYQQPCVKRPNLGYGVPFMYHHHHPPPPPPQPPHGHPHPHPHPHLHPQEPPPPSASASASAAPHPYNMLPLLHIRDADQDPHKGHVEDEWKNIHVMLNCILSMVEKTKKALGILQERGLTDTNFPDWNRKKSTEEVLALTVRQTEERIESIKKKAEDSMNEIRHQAMVELQKLVLAAENRMVELVAVERTRTSGNRSSGGASLQISPSSLISQYNSCWNCGRKAHETCSGCNTAQYCSSFCQHKDWDTHHQTCCVHSAATAAAAASATAIGTTVSTTVAATTTATATTSSSITAANCSGITAANSTGHHQQPSGVKKHQQPPPPSSSAVTADDLSVNRQPPQSTVASSSSSSSTSSSSASASAGDFDKQQQLQQPSAAVTASTVMTTAAAATVTANGDGGGGGGGKRQ